MENKLSLSPFGELDSPDTNLNFIPNCSTCSSEYQHKIRIIYSSYPIQEWMSLGLFDESVVESINEHWLMSDPPTATVHLVFAVLYGIIMFFGILGNLLALIVFCRCRSIRTPANYLILNLTISDFSLMVKIPIFIVNSVYKGPAVGNVGCQLYGFIGGAAGTASIMTLTMIAIDRYHAIVHPLNPFKKTTHRRALLMICFVWIYSITFASVPLFNVGGYVPEGLLTSCSFDYLETSTENRIFIFVYFIAAWLLPLSLIVFSYVAIYRIVLQAEKFSEFQRDGNSRITRIQSPRNRENRAMKKEWKITIVTTIIVLVWVLAWTPYAVVSLLGIFGQQNLITPIFSAVPALFCKTAACIDPFIYSLSHPKFKQQLRKLPVLSCCISKLGRRRTGHDTSSHYYSATCLAKSEDLENPIMLHSHPDLNHRNRSSTATAVIQVSVSTTTFTAKSKRVCQSLHDVRLDTPKVVGNERMWRAAVISDLAQEATDIFGNNEPIVTMTSLRRRSLPLACDTTRTSSYHEDAALNLQQLTTLSKERLDTLYSSVLLDDSARL